MRRTFTKEEAALAIACALALAAFSPTGNSQVGDYEKVVFDASVLFDSNKSALRPAGRETLDAFISRIGGLESQSIRAIGYADRRGSEGSNQTLSEARANTVKAYLVSKGITANRVQTSAKGETQPSAAATGCRDANTPRNVACMQPDRRVFLEISGARIADRTSPAAAGNSPPK